MIVEHYPSKKKKSFLPNINLYSYPKTTHSSTVDYVENEARKKGIDVIEWKRRDAIVREHFREAMHIKEGAKLWPCNKTKAVDYGEVVVDKIAYSYSQMDKDKWPDNDNPMIVTCHTQNEEGYSFFCTTNFLQATNPNIQLVDNEGSV